MNSIVNENYSIVRVFYLFSFLLFLCSTANSQEVLWSTPGVGERPSLSVQGTKPSEQLVLISSPFGNQVKATRLVDGGKVWTKKLLERVSYPTLALTDSAVVQGDQGTIWAVRSVDGEDLWVRRTPESLDYPMGPPRFREKAVFTISRRGVIRKIARTGQQTGAVLRDSSWGDRRAETVPLRSNQDQLSYLDQSGRLTMYDPETLQLVATQQLRPEGHDVLAGAVTEVGDTAWVTQLPGALHAVRTETGERAWSVALGSQDGLWSERGELLAVPSMLFWDQEIAVLVVTRQKAAIYHGDSGDRAASQTLPSPAVAPPAYDSEAQRWWILCRYHLVSFDRTSGWKRFPLRLVDEPFVLTTGDKSLLVGTLDGRVYRLSMPVVTE
jgi:hypothetical protein